MLALNNLKFVANRIKGFGDISIDKNIAQAKAFLRQYEDRLDDKTIQILKELSSIKDKSFFEKRIILLKYKLLKQGFIRNIGLPLKI